MRSRVTLADDHPVVLAGLRNLIRGEVDLELVGEAASGLAALKMIREMQPDVAVVDVSMPELNGIALSRRLAAECPFVRVLLLTLHEDRAYLKQALDAGVRGYVLKRSAAENSGPRHSGCSCRWPVRGYGHRGPHVRWRLHARQPVRECGRGQSIDGS